jgi:hypothetical protein
MQHLAAIHGLCGLIISTAEESIGQQGADISLVAHPAAGMVAGHGGQYAFHNLSTLSIKSTAFCRMMQRIIQLI